ncbi:glycosyl transferase [Leyella stercorea]|uniref:glycosyl transferase n=1 Tax=Leyella stercorea TaxID=363265 RepID=UPI00266CA959|nr:glycosyl transferase [Leyella stercorea]
MEKAPIILFAYIRLDTLQKTVLALQNNYLATQSDLFVFVDGPKNEEQKQKQKPLIEFLQSIDGFKSVHIEYSEVNKGLDPSIIAGVSSVIDKYGRAIVLEDDIVTTPNFLDYMNQALKTYESNKKVMSVSGFGLEVLKPKDYIADVYLFGRSTSWGWGTWKDRWDSVDWNISDWNQFKTDKKEIQRFKETGGSDMFSMLESCMDGGGMWDIRFCYNMFKQNRSSVIPFLSKVENVGFNELATHCKTVKYNRFKYILDTTKKRTFNMPDNLRLNQTIVKSRLKYQSLALRIYSKIRNLLNI